MEQLTLGSLIEVSHQMSRDKGWHDPDAPPATIRDRCMLVVTELAEAVEEFRAAKRPNEIYFPKAPGDHDAAEMLALATAGNKPEGIPIEIADGVIRIGDLSGAHSIHYAPVELQTPLVELDYWLEQDPEVRARWQQADSVATWTLLVSLYVAQAALGRRPNIPLDSNDSAAVMYPTNGREQAYALVCAVATMVRMSKEFEFDLERAITIKWAFNRTRPHRHGNKVM